jgi:hypothetical protein
MDGDEKRSGSIIAPRRRELNRGKKWKKLGMWMWILVVGQTIETIHRATYY